MKYENGEMIYTKKEEKSNDFWGTIFTFTITSPIVYTSILSLVSIFTRIDTEAKLNCIGIALIIATLVTGVTRISSIAEANRDKMNRILEIIENSEDN